MVFRLIIAAWYSSSEEHIYSFELLILFVGVTHMIISKTTKDQLFCIPDLFPTILHHTICLPSNKKKFVLTNLLFTIRFHYLLYP